MLKSIYDAMKSWVNSLLIPIVLGVLLGTTDAVRLPFAKIYPERDSVGGVAFPLAWVAGGKGHPASLEFVLVRQSMKPMTKLEFMRRGMATEMNGVFAGVAADRAGNAIPLTGGVNGVRFLQLEIPAKTLGGTSILLTPAARSRAKYVLSAGDVSKDLADPDDLLVQTKNEARRTMFLHLFVTLCVGIVSFHVARSRPLMHPRDQSPEDAQWV